MKYFIYFDDLLPETQNQITGFVANKLKKDLPDIDEMNLQEIIERNINKRYEITL